MLVKELAEKLNNTTKTLLEILDEICSSAKKATDVLSAKEVKYLTGMLDNNHSLTKKNKEKQKIDKKEISGAQKPAKKIKTAEIQALQKTNKPSVKKKTVKKSEVIEGVKHPETESAKKKEVKKGKTVKKQPVRIDKKGHIEEKNKLEAKVRIGKEKPGQLPAGVGEPKKAKPHIVEKAKEYPVKEVIHKIEPLEKEPVVTQPKVQEQVKPVSAPEPVRTIIRINEAITTGKLAAKMNVKVGDIIKALIKLNVLVTINQRLDRDIAELAAESFNYSVEYEDLSGVEIVTEEEVEEDKSKLKPRPPVVTIMGHVDHGKTSVLDVIRKSSITSQEAGGITQHIGAYQVKCKRGLITFLDTPGHEAFTAMRARGAKVTDIIVLVVAADDGVMPQTIEAIDHARAAEVPIIVAINKIDLPGSDIEKVKQGLSAKGLVSEEWGGKTVMVEISAKEKIGIDHLLEMILLEAEILELKANPDKKASGVVIEAQTNKQKGNVATVLLQSGTLNLRDPFVCGFTSGKVKAMYDDYGRKLTSALPSMVAEVLGFDSCSQVGDRFIVVDNEQLAREIISTRVIHRRQDEMTTVKKVTLEDLYKRIADGKIKQLNLIIKADVRGSVGALCDSIEKLNVKEIQLNIIRKDIGAINENDVNLAAASNALIIGLHIRPAMGAQFLAEKLGVDIRTYNIIYEVIDEIKKAMEGMLDPELKEVFLGRARVKEVFRTTKSRVILGCQVIEGKITNNAKARILRENVIVAESRVGSLRRFKDDVKEVNQGMECGISFENIINVKVDDEIECYLTEKIKKKLVIEE